MKVPCNVLWEWEGWARGFGGNQKDSLVMFWLSIVGNKEAKAMPVKGLEQGLGRVAKPAVPLARFMALGARDPFLRSGAQQRCSGRVLTPSAQGWSSGETRLARKLVLCSLQQVDLPPLHRDGRGPSRKQV